MPTLAPAGSGAGDQRSRPPTGEWRPVGRIEHQPVSECSGIVASRRYPGIFWVHNDSGHGAVLYAIEASGRLVAEVPVPGATNSDWEDIAADQQGHLFIADTGNNFHVFPVRFVYQIEEPDPHADPVKPARVIKRHVFTYPAERFDSEALFVRAEGMFVLPRQGGRETDVLRLAPGEGGKRVPQRATAVAARNLTGADLSPDGRRLLVCSAYAAWVFALDETGAVRKDVAPQTVRYPPGEIEACCFDGNDVLLVAESREIYRVAAADLAAGTRFRRPPEAPSEPPGR